MDPPPPYWYTTVLPRAGLRFWIEIGWYNVLPGRKALTTSGGVANGFV